MGEDIGVGLLEGSQTKSGIPIEHLDYRYVEQCKNGKELEKILKVLISGEEGIFPELIEFTEKRLQEVNPRSKSLRKEIPIKTYRDLTATEEQAITDDLKEWMDSINEADKYLKKQGMTSALGNDDLPPIRSAGNEDVPLTKKNNTDEKKEKTVLPRGYHEWDKFDPEKEIESLDKQEEEERKRKQEQVKVITENAIPSSLELKGKSETECQILAIREKEKGNEAFQSGNYSEALLYYCRSIGLNPKVTAVYNNRALTEIKLAKFEEAVDDCNRVICAEPNNVKAYLRRSIAHKGQGLKEKATEDLYRVLSIEPNNKRAKELLGEIKKNESLDKEPIAEPSARQGTKNLNDNSTLDDGTSLDNQENHNSVFKENTSTVTAKGKRLKIVDIESEKDSETNENLSGASCADKTNELQVSATQQIGFNDRTNESQNFHSVEEQHEEEKRIELPGLVIGAQDEGTRLFKLGRYAEAAEQFTKAIDILEKDELVYQSALCSVLCNRGSCLMKIGDCAGCVADCTSALKLLPGDFRSLLKRAQAYEISEKYAKAWFDYQLALRIQSQHQGALQGNLRVSKHLERVYGQNWKEVTLLITSQRSTAHDVLATNSAATQQDAPPRQSSHPSDTFGPTIPLQPSVHVDTSGTRPSPLTETSMVNSQEASDNSTVDPAVRFAQSKEKGNLLVKQNLFEEAVACYTHCIAINPENVAVYTNRALCYLRLEQNQLAIDDTTEALRLQPNNVKALFRRALAKKALSQYDSAARDLFELQKVEPKNAAAKKELEVVLDFCRKERRESAEKTAKAKKKKKKSVTKTEEEKPKANQEDKAPTWKRITIKEVQNDDEDDQQQPQNSSNTATQSNKVSVHQTESNTSAKPVKLVKKTAYDFFQAWNSVKKGNTKDYGNLLRQLETARLSKVLSNKLDAPMLTSIIAALNKEFVPQGEEKLACAILEQLTHVERFDVVLLFLSTKEKNELRELFSNLQTQISEQVFVTSEDFERLRTKYKM